MKKPILFLFALILPFSLMAQEKTKLKEVGLLFSDLNSFGITFKTGTNKSLWRFNTLFLSGSNNNETADSLESDNTNFGFNVGLGHEFRTNISNKLEFRYGADVFFKFNHLEYDTDDKTIDDKDRYTKKDYYEPGINFIIGLNYLISDNLVFGAELLPSISYKMGKEESEYYYNDYTLEKDISGFRYGFSNSSARLSLVYRF